MHFTGLSRSGLTTAYNSLDLWSGARTPLFDYLFVFGLPLFLMISLLIRDLFPTLRLDTNNGFLLQNSGWQTSSVGGTSDRIW